MSLCTNVDSLPWETRQRIHKDLEIKIESKFGMGQPKYVYPFEIDADNIKLPFAYAARTLKLKRPGRKDFPTMEVEFAFEPREEQ